MKNLLFLFFFFSFTAVFAQQPKINFAIQADIDAFKSSGKELSLIVRGNSELIKKEVLRLKGVIKLSTKNILHIKLRANLIKDFSKNQFVQYIEYSKSGTRVLNDTLKINNNVIPARAGDYPLRESYTGKGVLFGLIDTGIDIEHEDFKDTLGNTRILRVWDQREIANGTSGYGYGVVWDSSAINNGTATHEDSFPYKAHGTHVSGTAAGNGRAVNNYSGVATETNIIAVSVDFNSSENIILDAVDYIYKVADSLNMPCVINISLGDYSGSHDGTDGVALLIDSLINAKSGRALVCAAGNAGRYSFHLQHQVNSDTTFTWFKYNPSTNLGYGAVYYEIWADTADFNNINFSIGANLPSGTYSLRGSTPFDNIQNRIGNFTDTIKNNGNTIGIVDTYGELQGDKYLLQIHIKEPDSSNYYFSLMTTGSGKLDLWSDPSFTGTSEIVKTGLPSAAVYPNIIYYQEPDSSQTIVSSFSCLPSVLTVATYVNRKTYLDVDSIVQVVPETPGAIDLGSSIGPTRRGFLKPDIASTGRYVMSTTPDTVANYFIGIGQSDIVGFGGKHMSKNGTSMASPVVAGIVALYLEKCPNASMLEIKNAVISSAKQDLFTVGTPNPVYGYGKADAFAALNVSNYNVNIGSDSVVCDGDTLQITAPSSINYNWITSETTQSILVDSSKSVAVIVTNGSGCKGWSDTLDIMWRALPVKPIISLIGNDSLIYVSNLSLQWYYNGNSIVGEVDTLHVAQNNGDYYVEVSNNYLCKSISDTVTINAIGIEDVNSSVFNVYPNPTNGELTIQTSENIIVESVFLVNTMGKIVLNKKIKNGVKKLSLTTDRLPSGVYHLNLKTQKRSYVKQIILVR